VVGITREQSDNYIFCNNYLIVVSIFSQQEHSNIFIDYLASSSKDVSERQIFLDVSHNLPFQDNNFYIENG